MHVFTYGTLTFPEVWQAVVGRSFATVAGRAAGFAVFRVCDAVYPGIVAAGETDGVEGVVYLDVDATTLKLLDHFEDGFYRRQPIAVDCVNGERRIAECYVVPAEERGVLTVEPWSAAEFAARGDLARFMAGFAGFQRAAAERG
jgi:gamma-glutamylcyclotransferase (GGCT)/AIG2-like uncharacterized protein YtfP